jgi:hypothetical protein
MKRQRNRNRNGGGGGGGGGKPQQNANRAFDSNGPEGVKVRGAAQHVYEKYQQLARDATTAGDRVLAENYTQHAEHYFRVMRAMQPQRPLSEIIGRDQFVSGFDIDFEEEASAADSADGESDAEGGDAAEPERGSRPEARRDDYRQNDFRQNDYRQGEYRQNDGRRNDNRAGEARQSEGGSAEGRQGETRAWEPRPRDDYRGDRSQADRAQTDRGQGERFASDRPREDRPPRPPREDRPRFPRDDRPIRAERSEPPENDPLGVVEPEATPLTPSPRASEPAPILRADDGETSHAPAFLQPRTREPRAEGTEERRPRRRRVATPVAETPPDESGDA